MGCLCSAPTTGSTILSSGGVSSSAASSPPQLPPPPTTGSSGVSYSASSSVPPPPPPTTLSSGVPSSSASSPPPPILHHPGDSDELPGGAEEVRRLHEDREFWRQLEAVWRQDTEFQCRVCWDLSFVHCYNCGGLGLCPICFSY